MSAPKRAWQPASLVTAAWDAVEGASHILVVVDATFARHRISPDIEAVVEGVIKRRGKVNDSNDDVGLSLVLNKIDLVRINMKTHYFCI